jgi:hypothetical protein
MTQVSEDLAFFQRFHSEKNGNAVDEERVQ